ncbi:hypothetical protein CDD81_4426 [Ophiocordyceps australis]|uniref:Uncharacterized protein n=1 Tax=Ophiocordyceps australis TaxID=1399860 RepID=A0A2C5YJE3_9HYPO|nr:hypothetical protein CDD81_4426 [Ophiocordyceps australis]
MVQGVNGAWAHGASAAPDATLMDMDVDAAAGRKRKAESQDNERLSKRLSLLNLERNGSKLYVHVETPSSSSCAPSNAAPPPLQQGGQDVMQLDDTKNKVYIYNLDDELSSSDGESDDGKLVFLPDIDKHLRNQRIPPHVLANPQGELAGMQMVLYSDPRSLSVPEEHDSVRKAIIDARRRARDKYRQDAPSSAQETQSSISDAPTAPNVQLDDNEYDAMDID